MKNKLALFFILISNTFFYFAQTPQNIDIGKGRGESIWQSPWTIALLFGFVFLLIISRKWSKRIHEKRDSESEKDKKD
jgi:hypothetical protein